MPLIVWAKIKSLMWLEMGEEFIYVVALGASTAVGRDAWSSAAAVRGGISGFAQHPYMIDTAGEPMRVAAAPWLNINLKGVERFEALLYPAIDQVLEYLSSVNRYSLRIALSIGLPSPRPGLPVDLQPQLMDILDERYSRTFSAVVAFPKGHAAGLLALDAAITRFTQSTIDACVVAAADSYMEPETLEWLEECDQLHSAGSLNNAWGFVPSEGAGALLLARANVVEKLRLMPLARVVGTGISFEPNRIKTETICLGEGLTQAFRGALATLPADVKVTDIYCDMNGEPYRADEFGFAAVRVKERFDSVSDFVAPADCWGDVCAASGPLHIGLALIASRKNYSKGQKAMIWASSEAGERSAVVMAMSRSI